MLAHFIGVVFDGIAYGSLLFLISVGLSVTMGHYATPPARLVSTTGSMIGTVL